MTQAHTSANEPHAARNFLNSLPAPVAAPFVDNRPTIDLRARFLEAFPGFETSDIFFTIIHNYKIRLSFLGKAVSAARKCKTQRHQEAADLIEAEAKQLQDRLDSHYSALAAYPLLDAQKVQANWREELPVVDQLLERINIKDFDFWTPAYRAYAKTQELLDFYVRNLPPPGSPPGRFDEHLQFAVNDGRRQGAEASLDVAKRWAGWEALCLEESGVDSWEFFDARWSNYTQNNPNHLREQAEIRAEAQRIEEEARLAELERLEAPKRLAAEKAAASAVILREQFDTLLTTKGPALLKALERLVAEAEPAAARKREAGVLQAKEGGA